MVKQTTITFTFIASMSNSTMLSFFVVAMMEPTITRTNSVD